MRILIAIDSFKGSVSSKEAGEAVAEGIRRIPDIDAEIEIRPMADGGEGTTEALVEGIGGVYGTIAVDGPLGNRVNAKYGIVPERHLAIMEMAAASGITLIPPEKRNPLYTTTRGFGQMIRNAIEADGCRRLLLGIGGSATNDGGAGMLQALGFRLLDKNGNDIPHGAAGLEELAEIEIGHALPQLKQTEIRVACDVKNPLCGPNGCSAVFGPQKGATPEMISRMDAALRRFADLTKKVLPNSDMDAPGSGAAGGLGFALRSFLNARLESGVDIVLQETRLEEAIMKADIVITGEGRLDAQTVMGKAPIGVARLAKKHGKRVIAFSGCVTPDARVCNDAGIDAFFPVLRTLCTLDEALANAKQNIADTAEQVFRLFNS